jgi:hypothetical protein
MLLTLLCFAFGVCAAQERGPDGPVTGESLDRQLLVMLRSAPPHFRPDVSYGAYDAAAARAAQRRIAESLATQYELTLVNGWPMPVLAVDCFVMEARGGASLEQLIARLSTDSRVESVQSMNVFSVLGHCDPLYPLQPSAKLWRLDDLHKVATGKRVRVALIDTGVDTDHPDLIGRVTMTRNLVDGRGDVAELHGTAVAGIVGARADDRTGIMASPRCRSDGAARAGSKGGAQQPFAARSRSPRRSSSRSTTKSRSSTSIGGPRDRYSSVLMRVVARRDRRDRGRSGRRQNQLPGVARPSACRCQLTGRMRLQRALAPGRDIRSRRANSGASFPGLRLRRRM